jgi:hypothetical protein
MGRTALTVQTLSGPHPGVADTITFAAGDPGNDNDFTFTGKEIIIAYNSDATATWDLTLTSIADPFGRLVTLVKEMLPETYAIFEASDLTGWLQAGGKFFLTVENVAIELAVIRLSK